MRGTTVVVTGPAVEPITLADVYEHCRLETSGSPLGHPEDALLTRLIAAARRDAEGLTGTALITQTLRAHFPRFADCLEIRGPLQSVSSITYLDDAGVQQTLAASTYVVDTTSLPGRITLAYTGVWPTTYPHPLAVAVNFVAGYGSSGAAVPDNIRTALLELVAYRYENREASDMPRSVSDVFMNEQDFSF